MFQKMPHIFYVSLAITVLLPLSNSANALSCAKTGGYNLQKDVITYQQRSRRKNQNLNIRLQDVDPSSFHALTTKISRWDSCVNPYAADTNYAFYKGRIIEGVKGRGFKKHTEGQNSYTDGHVIVIHGIIVGKFGDQRTTLGDGYFKLGQNYFYHDIRLPGPLLKYIGAQYAVSARTVYHAGRPTDFDPQTFEIQGSYLRDKNGVYCNKTRQRLKADPSTFSVHFQKKSLGADKNHFFFECKQINQARGEYLDLFEHGFLRDANHVYFMQNPVRGLDAKSFAVHFQGGHYIQDKNGVYFITRKHFRSSTIKYKKIEGADLSTFQATGRSKARDMINLYQKNNRTGENWEGLKHKPSAFFRVHRKRLYKLSIPTPFAQNF